MRLQTPPWFSRLELRNAISLPTKNNGNLVSRKGPTNPVNLPVGACCNTYATLPVSAGAATLKALFEDNYR